MSTNFTPARSTILKKNKTKQKHHFQSKKSTRLAQHLHQKNPLKQNLSLEQFFGAQPLASYNFSSLGLGQAPAPLPPVGTKANPVSYSIL